MRWESTDAWDWRQRFGKDWKFDPGAPSSVRDDAVKGVREELTAREVTDALSDGFREHLQDERKGSMRETVLALDADGVLAPNRLALQAGMIQVLERLGGWRRVDPLRGRGHHPARL